MKAASEEVNGALQNAGQKPSTEGNTIYLDQVQMNDLPVLGVFFTLPLIHMSMVTVFTTYCIVFSILCQLSYNLTTVC